MAPMLSKPPRPPPGTPREAAELAARKARPVLDTFLKVLQTTIQSSAATVDEAARLFQGLGPLVDGCVKGSVRLLEAVCCFDFRRYVRGPARPRLLDSLAPLLVLMLISVLYNAFVFSYMPAAGIAFSSPTSMVFHAFIFLALSSYVQAARTDPGGVPVTKEWRSYGQPPPHVRERKRGTDQARWCQKSEVYKPDRAHYSTAMQRVVLKYDHHCPWLGTSIGFQNYKFFFLFMLYASGACATFNVNIIQLLVHATLPALDTFVLLGAESLTLVLTSILVPFTLFHAWLISHNMTTCEFYEERDANTEEPYPYDRGLFSNVCSSLGANPLLWPFPVVGPPGDGLSFQRASDWVVHGPPSHDGASAGAAPAAAAAAAAPAEAEAAPEAAHPGRGAASGEDVTSAPGEGAASGEEEQAEGPAAEEGLPAAHWDGWSDGWSETSVAVPPEGGGGCDFLVWRDAEEFADDVRVGCEVIEEAFEDTVLRLATACAGMLRRAGPAQRRKGPGVTQQGKGLRGKRAPSWQHRTSVASTAAPSALAFGGDSASD